MNKLTLITIISFLVSGCAGLGTYAVNVDAIAASNANEYKTYAVMPGVGASPGLEFDVYAKHVKSALQEKGLHSVDNVDAADAILLVGYQVGKANTSTHTSSVPVWGRTGYSGAQTYGYRVGNQYSSTTTYTPTYGVTGYRQVTSNQTIYPFMINLFAFKVDKAVKDKIKEVWSVNIMAESINQDLRKAFPFMIYAATPYIGEDSNGFVKVRVPKNVFQDGANKQQIK